MQLMLAVNQVPVYFDRFKTEVMVTQLMLAVIHSWC